MNSTAQTYPALAYGSLRMPMAAFEVLGYLAVVAVATLCFLAEWLPVNGAVVLTVILLTTLIVLSWIHLGQGRHPCFLFLCTLMFFQGGRLIGYCLGQIPDPLRVELMATPFSVSRYEAGLTLLLLTISAICVYAPCRWKYERLEFPSDVQVRRYLPYLYLVFFATLPVQLFKNYRYYDYIQEHGGYTSFYVNHAAVAASVPFLVRVFPLIVAPTFLAIFVFERRKGLVFLVTSLYLLTGSIILLMGSRGSIFGLVLVLWYVAKLRSSRKTKVLRLVVMALLLVLVADFIQSFRENPEDSGAYTFAPLKFLVSQGASLSVTEVAVKYRDTFGPYILLYLFHDLLAAFEVSDASNFVRGKRFDADMAVFLNPEIYRFGFGSGGAYVAEAYLVGGVLGVVVASLLIGSGLHWMYWYSRSALGLFFVAMLLPEVFWMARGSLLGWVSVGTRNAISILLLFVGWKVYAVVTSIRHSARASQAPMRAGSVG